MPNGEKVDAKGAPAASQETEKEVEISAEEASPQQEPDWKELLRIEHEKREKAEGDRDNYREGMLQYKRIAKKKAPVEEVEGEEDDKPLTRKELREVLREEVTPIRTESKLDSILTSLIANPEKRDYVREIYDNRIQKTGTSDEAIRTDLETALTLADAKKISKVNTELMRMENNRSVYVPPVDGGGAADKGIVKKPHQWTSEQEAALEARARSIGISDVEKYKESAWRELQAGTAFAAKPKPKA